MTTTQTVQTLYTFAPPLHTLPAGATRMINASEGIRLEVLRGCIWLTRPHDNVDHFLVAGSSMELHENWVLLQSDCIPRSSQSGDGMAGYALTGLRQRAGATPRGWMAKFARLISPYASPL